MKNRNWLCYVLDSLGITALISAAIALATALWFNAIVAEALLYSAFSYSLMAAVGAFLSARVVEIAKILLQPATSAATVADMEPAKAVAEVPELPRAA